jgi:PAS domain S-box-containing protein
MASTLIRTPEGRITYWSPEMEREYGYTADEALGQSSHDLLRPHHWQSRGEIESILADRSEWHGGIILHRADGQPVMVGSYWRLHADGTGLGSFVTEVHTDIANADSAASIELADVLTTIAQDLSQPMTAAAGFVGGTRRSLQQARFNRDLINRGLTEAAGQLSRAGEILGRVRALGASLRDPRLKELHQRLASTLERTEDLAHESKNIRQRAASTREESRQAREQHQAVQEAATGVVERAIILQNIQVYRRQLATHHSDEHTDRLIRQLLAEQEVKLAALDRKDVPDGAFI